VCSILKCMFVSTFNFELKSNERLIQRQERNVIELRALDWSDVYFRTHHVDW
jgi:hypothetical protein